MIAVHIGEVDRTAGDLIDHLGGLASEHDALLLGKIGALHSFLVESFEGIVVLIGGLVPVVEVAPWVYHSVTLHACAGG